MKEWALYSALALLAWGLCAFLPKVALSFLDPKTAFMFEVIGGATAGMFAILILKPPLGPMDLRGVMAAVVTGVVGYIGLLCFMYAIREGKICIVAPLTALYPVVTLALAMFFLKEKINIVQFAGIVLALISVILISHE